MYFFCENENENENENGNEKRKILIPSCFYPSKTFKHCWTTHLSIPLHNNAFSSNIHLTKMLVHRPT
jgi:hypothetical protein